MLSAKTHSLLQSNMTYSYRKRGPQYHWVVELFRHLKLPEFDGVHRALEQFNGLRMEKLEHEKTEKSPKRGECSRSREQRMHSVIRNGQRSMAMILQRQ